MKWRVLCSLKSFKNETLGGRPVDALHIDNASIYISYDSILVSGAGTWNTCMGRYTTHCKVAQRLVGGRGRVVCANGLFLLLHICIQPYLTQRSVDCGKHMAAQMSQP